MNILITGGCGFIGTNLTIKLAEQDHQIFIVDDFSTCRYENMPFLKKKFWDQVDIRNCDICNTEWLFKILPPKIDQIYHLACPASPPKYWKHPLKTLDINYIGTKNILEVAKKYKSEILFTSTSEIYGDPEQHPQKESYNGNVNPISPRSVYDEGKRIAETLVSEYHRQFNLKTKIARIFNSLTGDQKVIYLDDLGNFHYKSFSEAYEHINNSKNWNLFQVPSFNKEGKACFKRISGIHRHKVNKKGFKIKTTWNKEVKVTEDHSLFTVKHGKISPIFSKDIKVGTKIAVPNILPSFKDKKLEPFYLTDVLNRKNITCKISNNFLRENNVVINNNIKKSALSKNSKNTYFNQIKKSKNLSGYLTNKLNLKKIEKIASKHSNKLINNYISSIDKLLWILGFYLAEGCLVYTNNEKSIQFGSDQKYLELAKKYIKEIFDIDALLRPPSKDRSPNLYVCCRPIVDLIHDYFEFNKEKSLQKDIPNWIISLPKDQLVHFLYGFWCGDGNHDAKTNKKQIHFYSSSKSIIEKLNLIIMKFGIIPSISEFYTKITNHNDDKRYKSYRITIQGLDNNNILDLVNVKQINKFKKNNDITWATVKSIEEFNIDEYVYDFSVPENENFIAGTYGIYCHNTYGPYMDIDDGRVVTNFIKQYLRNEPITIYGDGQQTRSFCYIDDQVDGLITLMNTDKFINEPVNIGNPYECSMIDLACHISKSFDYKLEYKTLPVSDPKKRMPDISKMMILGWSPKVELREGLEKTIEYMKTEMKLL